VISKLLEGTLPERVKSFLDSEVAPVLRPELMEIKLWRRGVRW